MLGKTHYANGQKTYELAEQRLTYFFKNGTMKAEGLYWNDKMEGEWQFYRETGQLWQVGHFENGQKNGPWRRYNRSGDVEYEAVFKQNIQVHKVV